MRQSLQLISLTSLIMCLVGACHQPELSNILTGDSLQYWRFTVGHRDTTRYAYSFARDKTCHLYTYQNGNRTGLYAGDLIYPDTWELEGDTILNTRGYVNRILKYTSNRIMIQNIERGDTMILVRVTD